MGLLNATAVDPAAVADEHGHALIDGETVLFAFKTIRDVVAFTSWRVLEIQVQGITGSKKQYLSIPYRSVAAFSIESAGTFDLDAEVKLFVSGRGEIGFRIGRGADVRGLQAMLAAKLDR